MAYPLSSWKNNFAAKSQLIACQHTIISGNCILRRCLKPKARDSSHLMLFVLRGCRIFDGCEDNNGMLNFLCGCFYCASSLIDQGLEYLLQVFLHACGTSNFSSPSIESVRSHGPLDKYSNGPSVIIDKVDEVANGVASLLVLDSFRIRYISGLSNFSFQLYNHVGLLFLRNTDMFVFSQVTIFLFPFFTIDSQTIELMTHCKVYNEHGNS